MIQSPFEIQDWRQRLSLFLYKSSQVYRMPLTWTSQPRRLYLIILKIRAAPNIDQKRHFFLKKRVPQISLPSVQFYFSAFCIKIKLCVIFIKGSRSKSHMLFLSKLELELSQLTFTLHQQWRQEMCGICSELTIKTQTLF